MVKQYKANNPSGLLSNSHILVLVLANWLFLGIYSAL